MVLLTALMIAEGAALAAQSQVTSPKTEFGRDFAEDWRSARRSRRSVCSMRFASARSHSRKPTAWSR
jgi:hypothetical protein